MKQADDQPNYGSLGYDAMMRPTAGPLFQPSNYVSAIDRESSYEPTPYLNRTAISKGSVVTTLGGLIDFKDLTGGTSIITYDPASGNITLAGTLIFTNKNQFTGGSAGIDVYNAGGTVMSAVGIDSGGYGSMLSDGYYFRNNTANFLKEIYGVTAECADSSGVFAFRVVDNTGAEKFAARSNGEVSIQGNISAGYAKTDAVNLFVDAGGAGGKHRLMAQFQAGTAVMVVTEP
jgi:hypothetical protein